MLAVAIAGARVVFQRNNQIDSLLHAILFMRPVGVRLIHVDQRDERGDDEVRGCGAAKNGRRD
jgi:hypothetical protein